MWEENKDTFSHVTSRFLIFLQSLIEDMSYSNRGINQGKGDGGRVRTGGQKNQKGDSRQDVSKNSYSWQCEHEYVMKEP